MSNPITSSIRRTCLGIRKQLPIEFQHQMSHKICTRIRNLHQYRHAKHIALYHAINHEVDLNNIGRSAPLHGKYCYFPSINKDGILTFLPAIPGTGFRENDYGILEPDIEAHHALPINQFDIIFTPLVAFDPFGTRIGMGKGYYDKTLLHLRPKLLLGVAYEFQRQDYIAPETWDVKLDAIVTERAIYWSPS